MEKKWIGYDYITQEGNEIIKKAIAHYKARLENITKDRNVIELGASFVGLFEQESQKTLANVNQIIEVLSGDTNKISRLESQIPIIEKALNCLKYDISKIDDQKMLQENLSHIEKALQKIKEYS